MAMASKASGARLAALEVVRQVRERGAYAQEILAKQVDSSDLPSEERAFATKLVLGVVSATGTLDDVINRCLRSPSDVQDDVRDALRISTYEIIFLDKSPHAAVDQGVELVRAVTPKAAGLANAVLRKVVQARASFPFGDPTKDIAALGRTYAFPAWLTAGLVEEMGPHDAQDFMRASNDPAPLFIAVNTIMASDDAVVAAFEKAHECLEPVEEPNVAGCYRVQDSRALLVPEIKRLLKNGKILVSDAASQLVAASVLPDEKPRSFLEIGAGRATKTILLQSNAQRKWGSQIEEYTTLDNHAFKTNLLLERVEQYGVHVQEALTGDALDLDTVVGDMCFDEIFIDAPCSGMGTLRRHPEIRWRLRADDVWSFSRVQLGMLLSAASHVAPKGHMSYATCTVFGAENYGVVKAFLASEIGSSFELVPIFGASCVSTRLSTGSCDAHFAVRFVRK